MLRVSLLILLFAALPASAQPPASPNLLITRDAIGPVRLGMSEADLKALKLPLSQRFMYYHDSDMVSYSIDLDSKNRVFAYRDPKGRVISILESAAPGIATAAGAHVGATLRELRKLHPAGRVLKGESDTNYFDFSLAVKRVHGLDFGYMNFGFDPDAVGADCIVNNKHCPAELESMKSGWVELFLDESPIG